MKMEIVRKQLLSKLHRSTRSHQNTRKPIRMSRPCVNE
jgi:hypothetical protein